MDVEEHIVELERQGRALADAAASAGLGSPVPTCPGWTVHDVLRHTGGVNAWAATHVRAEPGAPSHLAEEDMVQPGEDPVGWYRERNAELVAALRAAPPDLAAWTFFGAPSPLAFWARRQAHETAIHRADAEAAAGGVDPAHYPTPFAADGIDELLVGFMSRRGRLRSDTPHTLRVAPDDVAERWLITIGPDGATGRSGDGAAECTLRGPAGRLYLYLWNRLDDVPVEGDAMLAAQWRRRARVTW